MNLILIHPDELTADGRAHISDVRAKHIRNILRAKPGKKLRIGLLNGPLGTGAVDVVSPEKVVLTCSFEAEPPPRPSIDILLAMPRPKVLKRLWAQFAALGVGRIFITNAEKVERCYFDTHILKPDFYNARLVEGLQQARDTLLPEVVVVKNLKQFLENEPFPMVGRKRLADPSGTRTIFQTLEDDAESTSRILLGIGPEGGWMPSELDLFRAHHFEIIGMGSRILRTDTACIALISMLAEARRMGV